MLFTRRKHAIGVDIGSRSIRIVKLTGSKEKPILANLGSIAIPKGAVSSGEIVDVGAVSESIQALVKKIGLREKNVVLGVGNQRVIVRFVDMPFMDSKELASAIKFQAQDFIPIPVEDAIIDYQVVGDYFNESGERFLQIMLVAAHKGMISLFIEAAEKGGLKPEIIDVNAFAIVRALASSGKAQPLEKSIVNNEKLLERQDVYAVEEGLEVNKSEEFLGPGTVHAEDNDLKPEISESIKESKDDQAKDKIQAEIEEVDESYFFDEKEGPPKITDGSGEKSDEISEREVVAYIDIGADITNLCIVEEDSIKFVRVIGLGGDDWTEALVEILGTSYDEAEEMKIKVGLPPLTGDRYLDVPGNYLDVADRVFNVLEREIIRFIGEVRRSFEYYISQSSGSKITKLVFSGGSSSLKNLSSYLEKGLDLSVEWRDPFYNISIPPRLKEQLTATDSLSYTIAVGLALRGFDG